MGGSAGGATSPVIAPPRQILEPVREEQRQPLEVLDGGPLHGDGARRESPEGRLAGRLVDVGEAARTAAQD
jgi:hypothetical protein